MKGDYILSVATDVATRKLAWIILKDSNNNVIYEEPLPERFETLPEDKERRNVNDFFVIANYVCREHGLKFVLRKNETSVTTHSGRIYRITDGLLEKAHK